MESRDKKKIDGIRKRKDLLRRFAPLRPVSSEKSIQEQNPESAAVPAKTKTKNEKSKAMPVKDPSLQTAGEEDLIIIESSGKKRYEALDEIAAQEIDAGAVKKETRRSRLIIWGLGVGVILALSAAILLSTVFAKFTLTVTPKVDDIELKGIAAILDTSVARLMPGGKVIPAEEFEFSRRLEQSFPSSGSKVINDHAKGRARVFNRFSSSPQLLASGTRFVTDSGVLFRLPRSVTVPGAKIEQGNIAPQFVETELVADQAGDKSNISGEVALNLPGFQGSPKYNGFYALALSGFSGGFQGKATVVSKEDLERAQTELTKKLYAEIADELSRKTPPGFRTLDPLRQIEITKLEIPPEGERVDNFQIGAEALGRMLTFREEDIHSFLKVAVESEGKELVPGATALKYQAGNVDLTKGKAALAISGQSGLKAIIPQSDFQDLIKGQSEAKILDLLRGDSRVSVFKMSFFPPWLSTAPRDPAKIKVTVNNP